MKAVHTILGIALILVAACASDSRDTLPPVFPDQKEPPEVVAPEASRGVVASPSTRTFHRPDCPEAAKIDPRTREFFATPYAALDKGFEPCDYCEPLKGWQ
jgi:hypothetical protein